MKMCIRDRTYPKKTDRQMPNSQTKTENTLQLTEEFIASSQVESDMMNFV